MAPIRSPLPADTNMLAKAICPECKTLPHVSPQHGMTELWLRIGLLQTARLIRSFRRKCGCEQPVAQGGKRIMCATRPATISRQRVDAHRAGHELGHENGSQAANPSQSLGIGEFAEADQT